MDNLVAEVKIDPDLSDEHPEAKISEESQPAKVKKKRARKLKVKREKDPLTGKPLKGKLKCDFCDYEVDTHDRRWRLKKHIKNKHENVRFHCDLCEYSTGIQSHLKAH